MARNRLYEYKTITSKGAKLHLIKMLGDYPDRLVITNHIEVFRDLFGKALKKATITEIGLWGELLVIETSSGVMFLIDCWHKLPKQTFDFNYGPGSVTISLVS